MFVCMCFAVTDKTIKDAITHNGVGNLRELRELLDIGNQCGKCVSMAQKIIDDTIIDESLYKNVG